MKKTLLKRVFCAGVAAAMMLSLGGCGKKNTPEVASKDNLYSAKEFELKDIENVMTMTASSDRIYIVSTKDIKVKNDGSNTPVEEDADSGSAAVARVMYGAVRTAVTAIAETEPAADTENADEVSDDTADTAEETPAEETAAPSDDTAVEEPVPAEEPAEEFIYYYQTILSAYDYEGNELAKKVIFDSQEKGQGFSYSVNRMFISGDKVCILASEYSWNMETGESTESFFIDKFSGDLSSSERVSLDGVKDQYDEDEYFYVNSYVEDESGNSYIHGGESIAVSDASGKFLFKLKLEQNSSQDSGSNISNVVKGKNGKIYALINSYSVVDDNYTSTTTAKTIDLEKKDFGTEEYNITAPISNYGNMSIDFGDYDLAYDGDTALYGYKIETDEKTVLIDWIKSGIDTTAPESIFVAPDGRIIYSSHKYELSGSGYSYSDGSLVINILTKLDPSEIPDKQLISVYTMYLPWDVKSKISEFNRESDKYQIEVTSYLDNNWNDYDNCLTRLNNDLVAGKIPDILIVESSLPFNSYVSKGLIADLNPIMEKDETFNREDYLENVFEALTVDGKLCRIATSFNIRTFAAKKSIVGDKESWTMDDFLAVAKANPDAEMMLETTSDGFIQTMVVSNMDQYVNYETGQCSFNSDSFKKILEYANTLPKEIDYDTLYQDDTYWMRRDTAFRENRAILRDEYIYDLRAFKQDEEGYFGEPVTFIGLPSDSGENGSMLQMDSSLAIMAKAKNPDGAWEFIKTLLTDEMQEKAGGLPVKLSAYDKLMETAKERPYWEDENGEKQYYDNEVWIGNEGVKITPNTDADNERMMNFIKSVKGTYSYDQDLFKIIDEEVQAYFSGQKSVDEVTELIQNRASTYVSENM